ncbi:DUF6801 domain-containing protein [Actinomadura sp. HBU206391]|uniref:DUF6801 domain-containing protein n=1 Tax=Actinomadura sp. HBU206391 TaxID=2731692 RepID=UPI00164EE4F4|nr:DUF6801 domain-containing protein [Actinomadura sp. HBU206391]MBC6461598.1 hypothetical protein [Actinomadura sp. HBU206391]
MRISVLWKPRRKARSAVAGVVAVAVGTLAGAGSAAGDQGGDATLAYTCRLPSGAHGVSVQIKARFPEAGAVQRPIRPTGVTVTVTFPSEALADLTEAGAATVAGTAQFKTAVAQGGSTTQVVWPGLTAPPVPMPGSGVLVLAASGDGPEVTTAEAGDVTFTAGALNVALMPRKADGAATEPPIMPVACSPLRGQSPLLATVRVPAPGGRTPPAQSGRPEPGRRDAVPIGPSAPRVEAEDPGIPADCEYIDDPGDSGCAYIIGYSNVSKLDGSALLGPGIMNIGGEIGEPCGPNRFCIPNFGKLNHQGRQELPPAPTTFLTFGFMPTKATMHLGHLGVIRIDTVLDFENLENSSVTVSGKMLIRLDGVKVNGVPLDVGRRCRLAYPMDMVLTASPFEYTIPFGGVLRGTVTIPPFTGCGVGEDLDPLLTGSISGPGNVVKMTQGNLCSLENGFGCPPTIPTPQR